MPQRYRVLLLIPHLGGGGAERVTELLAQHLSSAKYDLHLSLVAASTPPVPLPGVTLHALSASRVRNSLLPLLRLVRHLKPEVILSTMAHLNFAVLTLRPFYPRGTRILVRQNGTASAMLAGLRSPAITRRMYRVLYPRANRILCQSQSMADDLHTTAAIPRGLLAVVPNPVDIDTIRAQSIACTARSAGPHLLSVGRLAVEKGHDLLLDAFARVREVFPQASLSIAGQGGEEIHLQAQAARLGIHDSVRFLGHVDTPAALYGAATAFVLPSRHEGMPNALLEAAAAGLPLIATPASGGIADLLRDQPGAWLARAISAPALAEALITALGCLQPGTRFAHPWIDNFSLARSIAAYEEVIDDALAQGRA
ncbi:MAG TPA: glycosyltransferase [Terracidiphilus sp.]|jgi:glycosyltransferase involved in cell wall biosynthesis|nr:glycosyltransferase [Terracidiphilus sp.]